MLSLEVDNGVLAAVVAVGLVAAVVWRILRPLTFRKVRAAATNSRTPIDRQRFSAEAIPKDIDAIIVGSGISGLTSAVLLARVGWKVLVLEQHDRAVRRRSAQLERAQETHGLAWDVIHLHATGRMLPRVRGTWRRI